MKACIATGLYDEPTPREGRLIRFRDYAPNAFPESGFEKAHFYQKDGTAVFWRKFWNGARAKVYGVKAAVYGVADAIGFFTEDDHGRIDRQISRLTKSGKSLDEKIRKKEEEAEDILGRMQRASEKKKQAGIILNRCRSMEAGLVGAVQENALPTGELQAIVDDMHTVRQKQVAAAKAVIGYRQADATYQNALQVQKAAIRIYQEAKRANALRIAEYARMLATEGKK
jgi:hypothetical protein